MKKKPARRGFSVHLGVLALCFVLIPLGGCWPPDDDGLLPEPITLELADEATGWVQVRVTGPIGWGAHIEWGDDPDNETTVTPEVDLYEFFYQEAGEYDVELVLDGEVIATLMISVEVTDCHAYLAGVDERTVTIIYWARFGVDYRLIWDDQTATNLIGGRGPTEVTHTYEQPGTYVIRMGETWAPPQPKVTVTVE
jgi:hypothetical protein